MKPILLLSSAALMAVVFTGGCALQTPRGDPPYKTWSSNKSIDDVSACLVRELNARNKHASWDAPNTTHQIQIIEPNRVYEVLPQQTIILTGEAYYFRVEKMGAGSALSLFAIRAFKEQESPAGDICA